jgi:hypothetical protein
VGGGGYNVCDSKKEDISLTNIFHFYTNKRKKKKNLFLTLKSFFHLALTLSIIKSARARKHAPENIQNEQQGFFPKHLSD